MNARAGQFVAKLADIADGDSAGATAVIDGDERPLILVRRGERVFVYVNICPHAGAPLDWRPGQFLNLDRSRIQCAMHGAQFRIADGDCVLGPCVGRALAPVPAVVKGGRVYVVESR